MELPKASPVSAAGRALDGWLAGDLSIFPDRYAEMVRDALGPGMAAVLDDPQATATALVKQFRADEQAGH